MNTRCPGLSASNTGATEHVISNGSFCSASAGAAGKAPARQTSAMRSPGHTLRAASDTHAASILSRGPERSISTGHDRPSSLDAVRTLVAIFSHTTGSSCPQLMRAQSIPRATRSRTVLVSPASSADIVTMIRMRRLPCWRPNISFVFAARRRSPFRWSALDGRLAATAWSPTIAPTVAMTASRFGITRASLRPSDDRPHGRRSAWSDRRSRWRSAR